jgi:adenylate cyclase
MLKRAFRLCPIPPAIFYVFLAMAYRNNGEYEKAIELAKKGLSGNPDQLTAYLVLAASYSFLNRTVEARKAAEEIMRIQPNFSLEYYANIIPYKNHETKDRYVEALRNAGLPD